MILLASASPQRSQLLEQMGLPFQVIPQDADEASIVGGPPQALAIRRAEAKAQAAHWHDHQAAIAAGTACILGVDTLVYLGRDIIGKPEDRADAKRILSTLAGTTHTIVSAHVCWRPAVGELDASQAVGVSLAHITMRAMSEAEIDDYIASGESDGKAGAYALQESGDRFVEEIEGDRDTVIGLHVPTVVKLYREITGRNLLD